MLNRPFKLIIAGGKTGGHLFPGIAVAQAVQRLSSNAKILFVGTNAPFETQTLKTYGYGHRAIVSKPIKGGSIFSKLTSIFILIISLAQSLVIMKTVKPDFVLGVGGFSSFAVVLAAWLLHIPTAIQEQNAVPGLTNRMLAKFARTIFTSFEQTKGFTGLSKAQFTGNPVRKPELSEAASPSVLSGLDPDRFTLLITGGSQGAASINAAVLDAVKAMENPKAFNIIHQTGITEEQKIQDQYKAMGITVVAKAFFHDMPQVQAAADLIIARAGAGTLSELSILGKPAILVPFPYAADDHQTVNAKALEAQGAAVMMADVSLNGADLKTKIEELALDCERLETMKKNMKRLAMPHADKTIATYILNTKDKNA